MGYPALKLTVRLNHEYLKQHIGKIVRMVGEYVTYNYIRAKCGDIMMFGNYLGTEGDFFDTVQFRKA